MYDDIVGALEIAQEIIAERDGIDLAHLRNYDEFLDYLSDEDDETNIEETKD